MDTRLKLAAAWVAALLAAPQSASAEIAWPTAEQIDSWRTVSTLDHGAGAAVFDWDAGLRREIKTDARSAADRLAPRYGLSQADMRELVLLYIAGDRTGEGIGKVDSRSLQEIQARFGALVRRTGYSTLVLEAAGEAIETPWRCPPGGLTELIRGAPHPAQAAWALAQDTTCEAWFGEAVAADPQHPTAPLVKLATNGTLPRSDSLPLLQWLWTEGAARVAEPDRTAWKTRVGRSYLSELLDAGLASEAMALVDSMPADLRSAVLDERPVVQDIHVDEVVLRSDEPRTSYPASGLRLGVVAAEWLLGRTDQARHDLEADPLLLKERASFACLTAATTSKTCPAQPLENGAALFLDTLLNRPGDDPYYMAEAYLQTPQDHRGVMADVVCRLFAEPQYGDRCKIARSGTAADDSDERDAALPKDAMSLGLEGAGEETDAKAAVRALSRADLPTFNERRAIFASALKAAVLRYGGRPSKADDRLARPKALPPRFAAQPLAPGLRGEGPKGESGLPKGFAPLPRGFMPVRGERTGAHAVEISLSQLYDPTGEVSAGGYWVHLSDDGGKTWRRPLYTGLAHLFPYVVKGSSKLPLLYGEELKIAVDVRELDPDSITYPPVALRTLHKQDDLFVTIPLAELARDSDGDGLTDIAAEHLLLSPAQETAGRRSPVLVRPGTTAACTGAAAARGELLSAVLAQVFGAPDHAVHEPVDRKPGDLAAIASGRQMDVQPVDRPIFVAGRPEDFACVRSSRIMIVYSPDDLAELRRRTPDFHPAKLDPPVMNRAGDRGYVVWSGGWVGGTYRIRRVDGRWRLDTISNWMS